MLLLLIFVVLCSSGYAYENYHHQKAHPDRNILEPEFVNVLPNVTVKRGETVGIPCCIDGLGDYKVSLLHVTSHTLLMVKGRLVTHTDRFKLSHKKNSDDKSVLEIEDQRESVWGIYNCDIKTTPMKAEDNWVELVEPSTGIPEPDIVNIVPSLTNAAKMNYVCNLENDVNYTVAWIYLTRYRGVMLKNKMVTRDPRITVWHEYPPTWWLNIEDATESDSGAYFCQIHTDPPKQLAAHVDVRKPDKSESNEISTYKNVPEGSDVSLRCNTSSTSKITWSREDGKYIQIGEREVETVETDILEINKANLQHMGVYRCLEEDGDNPAISHRIMLSINSLVVPPKILFVDESAEADIGSKVIFDCIVECHSEAATYWSRDDGEVILPPKYRSILNDIDDSRKRMRLVIENVTVQDSGNYVCVASNSLKIETGNVYLAVHEDPTESPVHLPQSGTTSYHSISNIATVSAIFIGVLLIIVL